MSFIIGRIQMINLIILINNVENIKQFINNLIFKISNLNSIFIAHNITEFQNLIKKFRPDLIIISKFYYSALSNPNILNYHSFQIFFYNSKIYLQNSNNDICLLCSINDTNLLNTIQEFINNKTENELKNRISSILNEFNFNFKLIGTNYLIDAILYSYINKDSYIFENLEKNVYSHICFKNNTNPKNIKWAIVRAINNMYLNSDNNNIKKISEYFYLDIYEKPTAKIIITMIINKL